MEAEREDNGEVIENWIIWSGDTVAIEKGDEITLDDLDYKYPLEELFIFAAVDQAGNTAKEVVKLNIAVPELDIEKIDYVWVGAEITTLLSDTIDRGQIKFERNRLGYREPLEPDTYPVKPLDPRVTWGLYPFDTSIHFYDSEWNQVWSINTETGEISGSDGLQTDVSFAPDGRWNVNVSLPGWAWNGAGDTWNWNGAWGNSWWWDWSWAWWAGSWSADIPIWTWPWMQDTLFSVGLQAKELPEDGITLLDAGYELITMDNTFVGGFVEGYCIRPTRTRMSYLC